MAIKYNKAHIQQVGGCVDFRIEDSICNVWGSVITQGNDCTIAIQGGVAPHVGCAVLAIPRPSLTGTGMSATVSCLNRTGHMDDAIAAAVAKQVAAARNCAVACSCGIHLDGASPQDIQHIQGLSTSIVRAVLTVLEK